MFYVVIANKVKVIHFNAGWNEANDVEWFDKLSDAGKKSLSIDSTEIQNESLTAADLAGGSVGTSEIINESITAADLAANSV